MSGAPASSGVCPLPATVGERIEIAHGGGGRLTQQLIDTIFKPAFASCGDDLTGDSAVIGFERSQLAFTTDAHVVQPLFFPGGDIGSLAVYGTVNDLAMSGARPLAISAAFIIEEGFPVADLRRVVRSMSEAAKTAGVRIVAGDTKVVERGKADGLFLTTAGVGEVVAMQSVHPHSVQVGDAVLVSGDIGRHGMAVMAAREQLGFEPPIRSDCAPLVEPVLAILDAGIEVHCLRDLTRGGLATALIEIAGTAGVTIAITQANIPVSDPVRGACEILGLDPLYVANEGRFAAIVPSEQAQLTLAVLRQFDRAAAKIGEVGHHASGASLTMTTLGSTLALDLQTGEQLPRIC